jgi:hypothetical protein
MKSKIELPTISVIKVRKEWKVEFWINNQGFLLDYGGTKSEASWMARMLSNAFKKITVIKESQEGGCLGCREPLSKYCDKCKHQLES